VAAPTPANRRFEALVSVGPALLAPGAPACLGPALDAGLAVAVVAPGVLDARSVPLAPGVGHAPLLLASADGPERVVVDDLGARSTPALAPDRAHEVLDHARRAVLDDLHALGLPVEPGGGPDEDRTARLTLAVSDGDGDAEDHVRHVLAGVGLSGRVALAERVAGVATRADERVRVRVDDRTVVLGLTDTGDAVRWVLAELGAHGIGAEGVLVLVDGPLRLEPAMAALAHEEPALVVVGAPDAPSPADALAAQVDLRRAGALPVPPSAPGWCLDVDGEAEEAGMSSALASLADGRLGIGGPSVVDEPGVEAWALVAGVYDGEGSEAHLLPGPVAFGLPFRRAPGGVLRRTLDLRTGTLHKRVECEAGMVEAVRFTSLRRPGTVALRAALPCDPGSHAVPVLPPPGQEGEVVAEGDVSWVAAPATSGGIVVAATQTISGGDGPVTLDRVATYVGDPEQQPDPREAVAGAREGAQLGFDRLLSEHRAAWASRWADADIEVEGDDDLQLAVRFALFHLMGSVADEGEAAVGARGLTGPGYRGHVFWDADTFVLPFLAATHPSSARAMLEYRIRRLDAARAIARSLGRRGARFPWESARTGFDVTPTSVKDRTGQVVPIRTGQLEEHIVAQVAWAACCYVDWTGDQDFARGAGLDLLVETARYWVSRVRRSPDRRAHIFGVIGPDEYHEPVDDSAFTNVLARWNLRRAAEAVEDAGVGVHDVLPEEVRAWEELAGALVDGYDPSTGIYEQFAGFFDLEPLVIAEVAPRRPITADLLLGRERVRGAQVVKQADVLMLHHLVPDEVAPGSLEPNLRYYEPRTAHGSSLSPAIHAGLFARVRDFDRALPALALAARIDLDDLTRTTAGGLHVATMGGLWQALAFGFAGLRPRGRRLCVDPRLPPAWPGMALRVGFRGSRVQVRIEHDRLRLEADHPVGVEVDGRPVTVDAAGVELRRHGPSWEVIA